MLVCVFPSPRNVTKEKIDRRRDSKYSTHEVLEKPKQGKDNFIASTHKTKGKIQESAIKKLESNMQKS